MFPYKIYAENCVMSELSNVALFVRVVEDGSFSAAARFLGMMPSSISRQISQLETELGTRLFHRTTRRQHLTEAGEIYLQHAQRIVADLDAAKLAISQLAQNPSGCLNVAIEADFANVYIAPILADFLKLYPEIQIRFLMNTKVVDLIDSGIDIAIRIGKLDDSSLYVRKIANYQAIICASPDYLKRHGTPAHPDELNSHNCLSFNIQRRKIYWGFEVNGETKNIEINGKINANNLLFLKSSAVSGVGIVNLPIWMAQDEIQQKRLVPILEEFALNPSSVPIQAVFAHNRHLAPKVRAFIDYLVEQLAVSSLLSK